MGKRSRESMGDPAAGVPEGKSKKRKNDADGDKGKKKRLRELKKDITDLPGFEDDDNENGDEGKQGADEAGGVKVNGGDEVVLSKKAEKKRRKKEQEEKEALKQEEATAKDGADAEADAEAEEGQEPKKAKKDKKDKKDKKKKSDKKSKKAEATANGEEMDVDESEEQGEAKVTEEPKQEDEVQEGEEEEAAVQGKAPRFIVFVGNLPYSATAASIQNHFAPLNPTSVRCLTKRDDPTKCRGCAFIEFNSSKNMRTCLDKWHHSTFEDGVSKARKINVELTAGGGGKTANRMEKIKKKNEKLNVNRTKRIEAEKKEKNAKASGKEAGGERPQDSMHPSRRARMGK